MGMSVYLGCILTASCMVYSSFQIPLGLKILQHVLLLNVAFLVLVDFTPSVFDKILAYRIHLHLIFAKLFYEWHCLIQIELTIVINIIFTENLVY